MPVNVEPAGELLEPSVSNRVAGQRRRRERERLHHANHDGDSLLLRPSPDLYSFISQFSLFRLRPQLLELPDHRTRVLLNRYGEPANMLSG